MGGQRGLRDPGGPGGFGDFEVLKGQIQNAA